MKVAVTLETAPPVMDWVSVLTRRGWQISRHDSDVAAARRKVGSSEYPVRLATTWHVRVEDDGADGVEVTIHVPSFAESSYARARLLETIRDWSTEVDGPCGTTVSFEVDILERLRNGTE